MMALIPHHFNVLLHMNKIGKLVSLGRKTPIQMELSYCKLESV